MNASLLISIQTKLAVNRKCKIHFELVKHILTVDLLFSALIGFFSFHSYIKLSSPNLNNLIILGCIFIYVSTYFIAMDGQTIKPSALPGVCVVRGLQM